MAAYPTSPVFTVRSKKLERDTLETVRADNGALSAYAWGPGRKAEFELEHNGITAAERNALLAFYDANRILGGIALTWADGVIYTCLFTAPPDVTPLGADRWRVVMRLGQA